MTISRESVSKNIAFFLRLYIEQRFNELKYVTKIELIDFNIVRTVLISLNALRMP